MNHDKSPVSTFNSWNNGVPCTIMPSATEKSDVFSYRDVVLEVACGRRPIDKGQRMVNLADWVWDLHSKGKIREAIDRRIQGEIEEEEMRKLLLQGLRCANPDNTERSSMRKMLQILNSEVELLFVPKMKQCLTFSFGLPLTSDEIVSDAEDFSTTQSMS